MAATAAVRPPQANPGMDGGSGTNQNPAQSSHPQHHVPAQPVFYVPSPHPPPFLHYQWPMPFSYNPFAGFPGMGYGMVMPPFPPPYMEPPAYILPHPHIPPMDYRLLLHPQVHATNAPYQNPNQTRRVRHPQAFPARETVNSEVQTEPPRRGGGHFGGGSPLVSSDSGHGAASSSLSSSHSSLQKQGSPSSPPSSSLSKKQKSPKINNNLPSKQKKDDFQADRTYSSSSIKHSFNILHPTGLKTVQPCISAAAETKNRPKDSLDKENTVSYRNTHCNIWSVSSTDSLTPVCNSSQREDVIVKQRRVSVPDILMSWGGGTPQAAKLKMADKDLPQNENQSLSSEVEHEKSVYQSLTETNNGPVVADSADAESILSSKDTGLVFKILKLPFALNELLSESRGNDPVGLVDSVQHNLSYNNELNSLSKSQKLPDHELENDSETSLLETIEIIPNQICFSSSHMKRNMNESVWSVESLAPFVPKDWLMQNCMSECEVIEMTEEAKNGQLSPQNDNLNVQASKERRRSRKFSSLFNSPAEKLSLPKMPEMETEIEVSDIGLSKQGQSVAPSEKDPLAFSTCLLSKNHSSTPNEEDVGEKRSSEPEANQSPNQESCIIIKQQVKSPFRGPIQESDIVTEKHVEIPCSPEKEETLASNSTGGKKILPTNHSDGDSMRVEEGVYGNEYGQLRSEQLHVPVAHPKMVEVSPSKGYLVDCGIQCTDLQEQKCSCEELKTNMGPNEKYIKNGKAEGFSINGQVQKPYKRHGQRRNNRQEKHNSPPEGYNRYYGKPGKQKGGNGRYPQY